MKIVKTFVINLKTDIERRKNITGQLDLLKIDYEIIDAIFGKNLSSITNPEIDWEFANKNAHWVSKGLLACSLSHLLAYRAIIDQNLKYGLILEDDTTLSPDISLILSNIEEKLEENEVLMLYYASWKKCLLSNKSRKHVINDYTIVNPINPKQLISANAYIITNKACKEILKFQNPLKTTSDSWGVYFENKVIHNIKCLYPMAAEPTDYKSSIDYINTDSYLSVVLKTVEKYKIFPLYQILKYRRKKMRKAMLNFELVS